MIHLKLLTVLVILGLATAACQPRTPVGTPTSVLVETPSLLPTMTVTPIPERSPTPAVAFTATVTAPARPQETILIQEPGPGSQVNSPIRVVGFADPTIGQNLVIRIVRDDGTELNQVLTDIQAGVGQRGKFEVAVPIDLETTHNLFIQAYSISLRDGGVTHLSSTGVVFSTAELENITVQEPRPEQIAIFQPQGGGRVSGGVAHVEGFALATFEQTLVVEILDADGNIAGSEAITVQAPDLGQPGPFSVDIAYSVAEPGPGRVVVRDPSPAFGGDTHLNSVEITLEP